MYSLKNNSANNTAVKIKVTRKVVGKEELLKGSESYCY